MSLSSEWRPADSQLRRFLDTRLTETKAIRADWNQAVGDRELWWPYPESVNPPYGAVGMAYDYRLRLALGESFEGLTGWKGFLMLSEDLESQPDPQRRFGRRWQEEPSGRSVATRAAASWACQVLDRASIVSVPDDELTRDCFVLAWLEEFYRRGLEVRSPLYGLAPGAGASEVLALVDDTWVQDVVRMVDLTDPVLKKRTDEHVVFGPAFLGSYDVNGADGDLIIRRTLVEIKTTKGRSPDRRALCQLAGYLLLDYKDWHGIERVGICSGRWGTFHQWDADEYLAKLAGVDQTSVPEMTRMLRAALRPTAT